ncbi:MAG: HXXEE domain-containing protein [Clostridiales bacterium]|nr:HXXEE domain-containing protein [Clostridiales bacterium]
MAKKLDKWCDINWIIFICITGVAAAALAAIFWDRMPLGALGAVFVAVTMPFHVLEEWKFPGGLHHFYNVLLGPGEGEGRELDRYPMSRLTDMITNIGLQWIPLIYIILCFFANLSNAVALCMMFLSFIEVLVHTGAGILTWSWLKDEGKKSFYHPGIATSWMLFFPAGVYIAAHLENVTLHDWIWCVCLFIIMMLICIPLTETPLKKWVVKQDKGMFAFKDAKYYEKYPGFVKKVDGFRRKK